jgi:ATP-dependent DNA helicase RecG
MFLRELTVSPDHLKGAGDSVIKTLAQSGLVSTADLLSRYPRSWEERSRIIPLKDFNRYNNVCTLVRVLSHDWIHGKTRTLKVRIEDDTREAVLLCFNRAFLEKQLVIGRLYRIWGHFSYKYGELQSSSFEIEAFGHDQMPSTEEAFFQGSALFGKILPKYPNLKSNNLFRKFIKEALRQYGMYLENELPGYLIEKHNLLPKAQAIRAIHFPENRGELERAKKTLIYEELFYLEVMVGKRAFARKSRNNTAYNEMSGGGGEDLSREVTGASEPGGAASINVNALGRKKQEDSDGIAPPHYSRLQSSLLERLPFALTAGQAQAVDEINRDLDGDFAASRLLQGDVGSGKTLVSFMAALRVVERGGQVAMMAPTELLARQHAENAARLLEPLGLRVAFLTGNTKTTGRNNLLKALAAGDIDIVLGTHALFSRNLVYKNLSLIIIDEQHRFGVTQRQAIIAKGDNPDLLMMSATPIPRTLTLTLFGDMDISVIHDMPPGRKSVITHLAKESNENKVYEFVRKELESGTQAYFVYPLIESNEDMDLKDAQSMAKRLSEEVFPQFSCALIHSKLDEEKKREIMDAFRKGDITVLCATSVVEVGVDVPNANCMVIEHAERFGLSALHQLRGRVGRGDKQSYCFLVYADQEASETQQNVLPQMLGEEERSKEGKRLMTMLENSDGFIIAEKDLLFRGGGQISGTEQSGFIKTGISDPVRDIKLLALAREDAFAMLKKDEQLLLPEHRIVSEVLKRAPPFAEPGL